MTVALSIKEVPEELAEALRARAERNHRSLQGELMHILEDAIGHRPFNVKALRAEIKKLGFSTPSEATRIVREGRGRI